LIISILLIVFLAFCYLFPSFFPKIILTVLAFFYTHGTFFSEVAVIGALHQ